MKLVSGLGVFAIVILGSDLLPVAVDARPSPKMIARLQDDALSFLKREFPAMCWCYSPNCGPKCFTCC